MREIKFRAWDKRKKKMFRVDSLTLDRLGRITCGFQHNEHSVEMFGCEDMHEHLNIELMQYAGLKDRNNKEIFEGDIVKWDMIGSPNPDEREHIRKVYWFNDGFFGQDISGNNYCDMSLSEFVSVCKIIGNIYENPELIK